MDIAKVLADKREKILSIAAKHGAHNVRVFGSVARGDFGANSDIDILIRLDSSDLEGMRYFSVLESLREELEGLLGCGVDIVDEAGLKDRIREQVLSEAKAL